MAAEMEYLNMAEQVVNETVNMANMASAQAAVALDTMLQLQKEKDAEYLATIENMDKRHAEEKNDMRKHYQKIILSISLAFSLFIGALIGGIVYIVSNFDFEFQPNYTQITSAAGGGDSTIEDGIKVNQLPPTD